MKKVLGTVMLTVLLTLGLSSKAQSETLLGDYLAKSGIEAEVSATMDFYDKYVWRGQILDTDGVVQPGIAVTVGGFEMGLWGSYDIENDDGAASDEQDGWIAYTHAMEALSITVGHTWYDFPEGGSSSKELYVSVGYDTFLSPSVTLYHDYEDGKDAIAGGGNGNYWAIDIGHSLTLSEDYGITLDLAATYGIYDGQWYEDGTHITPSIGLTIPLTDNLTVSPVVSFNRNLTGELADSVDDETYVGVSVAYSS